MTDLRSVHDVAAIVRAASSPEYRIVVGIAGSPGAGKSTLAAQLVDELGDAAVLVPMDGFHLPQHELVRQGTRGRMGAPDTFDVDGFLETLVAIRRGYATPGAETAGSAVAAPGFDREREEPVVGAVSVPPDRSIVVVEGNYLLLGEGTWARVAPLLDVTFFVELDRETRLQRLVARHVKFGKTDSEATAWALGPDETNARLIEGTAGRADYRIALG